MTYSPSKRAGLFCATGRHGHVKADGHYMDDLWAYDINANAWICLYPGAGTPSSDDPLDLHLDASGFEVNAQGDHIPVSYLSHCYANTTYNSDQDRYQIFWTQCPWWCDALPQRFTWLNKTECSYGSVPDPIANTKHPLFFDVNTGKWDRRFVTGTGPDAGRHEGVLEYIPTIKKTFWKYKSGHVWLYDYPTNTWEEITYSGANLGGSSYDYLGCYDSKRDRVYVAKGSDFWYYDIQANACTKISASNQPGLGATNGTTFSYDSANDIILAGVSSSNANNKILYAYSAVSNRWTNVGLLPQNIIPYQHYATVHSFYDPVLNVHFFYLAFDSGNDNATMMAYRYKKNGATISGRRVNNNGGISIVTMPNPFSSSTTFRIDCRLKIVDCRLKIYDINGKMVDDLTSRIKDQQSSILNQISWNAARLPEGIYILKAVIGRHTVSKKLVLK
jgi:hypothetical protein